MKALGRAARAMATRGPLEVLRAGSRQLVDRVTLSYLWARTFHSRRTFLVGGRRYRYLVRRYNSTWRSERVVEVPVVWDLVEQARGARVLEVGNVLRHYFPVAHHCVDKYERAPGVLNVDVVDYKADPYDLIVSISTLEHVGWDEDPREPGKVLRAIQNLRSLIAPGGRLVVTLPIAFNPYVDESLKEGRIAFDRHLCLRRVSRDNRWEETAWDQAMAARFDTPFRRINAVVIGTIDGPHPRRAASAS